MKLLFVVTQRDGIWHVDQKNGDNLIKHTEHTSKRRALSSIYNRLVAVRQFYVLIPDAGEVKGNGN